MIFKPTYDYSALCDLNSSSDEPLKRTFDAFGKLHATKRHILWRGEFRHEYYGWDGEPYDEDFIAYLTLCHLPTKRDPFLGQGVFASRNDYTHCFSYSIGDTDYEARYTSEILTPLKITIPEEDCSYDPLKDRDAITKICKKLNWHLPIGYQDFTI